MKNDECYKLIAVLFTSYPSANLDQKNAESYMSGIIDLPADAAGAAADRLRRTKTFLPSIAEIREATADVVLGPRRSGEDAYRVVLETIRKVGRYDTPRFSDPHLVRAMGVWGTWVETCDSPVDDPGGRARFIAMYEQGVNAERADIVSGIPLPAPRGGKPEYLLASKRPRLKQ